MSGAFSKNLSALRKDQNLSQKQAAQNLGISQALLSHYEKGIRECGLDFVCRAADYYSVSTDYLLGRSSMRNPDDQDNSYLEISDDAPASVKAQAAMLRHERRVLMDSLNIVFGLLEKINSNSLSREAVVYMCTALNGLYQMLKSSGGARQGDTELLLRLAIAENRCRSILRGDGPPGEPALDKNQMPAVNNDVLKQEFEHTADSLFELIGIARRPLPNLWSDS